MLMRENSTFIINMNCFDIVSNDTFLEAEKSGNSTKDQPVDDEYICRQFVTFDNSEYCCCPNRKQYLIPFLIE